MSKKSKEPQTEEAGKSVDELILNYPNGKYSAVPLAALWAKVLRKREENRHLTPAELLNLSLKDVLGGSVDWRDVKKALAAEPSDPLAALDKKK
ncbi:MAG: hypothetical protein KGO96_06570 [Elusimicrobia bacterium]|nr:hypothetical protein [Elusimicrobiota bacterium]MDE2237593.1 hypothetical protein [Elusimicrobiota bacterium]MDE2425554.1 hypothetical protein [Elusimicrobiota bacterium]